MSAATSSLWIPPQQKGADRFPEIDPKVKPTGHRVLVQLRRSSGKISGSSLIATENTMNLELYKCQVAKLIAAGPTAYLDRETGMPWFGGPWAKIGAYVRIPAHGGDRWSIVVDGDHSNPVGFAIINDDNILGIVTDPDAD